MKKGILTLVSAVFACGLLFSQEIAIAELPSPCVDLKGMNPGDESDLIFDDNLGIASIGAVPAKWNILDGNALVTENPDGNKMIQLAPVATISPRFSQKAPYLPKNYTIEFEFYLDRNRIEGDAYNFQLREDPLSSLCDIRIENDMNGDFIYKWKWITPRGEEKESALPANLEKDAWHKISLWVKNEKVRVFINNRLAIDIPAVAGANELWINSVSSEITKKNYIRAVKIAQQSAL